MRNSNNASPDQDQLENQEPGGPRLYTPGKLFFTRQQTRKRYFDLGENVARTRGFKKPFSVLDMFSRLLTNNDILCFIYLFVCFFLSHRSIEHASSHHGGSKMVNLVEKAPGSESFMCRCNAVTRDSYCRR